MVLAASYEAKAYGVHGGMPGWRARQLCPELVFVRRALRASTSGSADRVMTVLGDVTPLVERISIDEAFLDVSGATHLFGPPAAIAAAIRRRVRDEVGLPISVGAARTKHLAKVASQVAKPDGLVVVEPGPRAEFLDPLPVGLMWGVGPVTRQRLAERGIRTIGELRRHAVGGAGAPAGSGRRREARRARASTTTRGASRRPGAPARWAPSRRSDAAGPTRELVREVLAHLADRVAGRLRAKHRAGADRRRSGCGSRACARSRGRTRCPRRSPRR